MEINKEEYAELIEVSAQKRVLIREMTSRVESGTDYISLEALRVIFGLCGIVPETNKSNSDKVD